MVTASQPALMVGMLEEEDTSIYSPVPAQLTEWDKKSLLAIQKAVRDRGRPYSYLEIGSHLGGSLQPYVVDPLCERVFSIDRRPLRQPDERGRDYYYDGNSTQRMLDLLAGVYGRAVEKIKCFECDASEVDKTQIDVPPTICFIDGEHTDNAVMRDFLSCLNVARDGAAFVFHDAAVVFKGLRKCLHHLDIMGKKYSAYVLPQRCAVIEVGDLALYRHESVLRIHAVDLLGLLEGLQDFDPYRDFYFRISRSWPYRLAKRARRFIDRREVPGS